MPSSLRRRLLRMGLSVNRKLTSYRWIGNTTVGVVRVVRHDPSRLKAIERAEKSPRKRKRVRGRRCGKERSRGRHPRSKPPPPALKPKEPKDRTIIKHLRACDHWFDRQEQFGELFKESQTYRLSVATSPKRLLLPKLIEPYRAWKKRWLTLRNRAVICGEGVVWCSRIGPSFSYWLEQRFGIIVVFVDKYHNQRYGPIARSTLLSMEDEIRIRNDNFSRRPTTNKRLGRSLHPGKKTVPTVEPKQLIVRRKTVCSHCGGPAFAWNQHQCVQAWRKAAGIRNNTNNPH